jgi:uncharacterized membrane protein
MSHPAPADRDVRSLGRAGFVLGVALGGFFDGILLHQVLQWHHLLSLVPGEDLRRIETQILGDGAFHVLMYLVALAGLWMLWRARFAMADEGSGRRLLVAALLGFGVWNVVDVVGFHWVLHIHRIRVDVPVGDRLGWDLLWLALFGAIPLVAAALLARGRRGGGRGPLAPAALGLLVVLGGGLSTRAPDGTARLVLFASGTDAAAAIEAVAAENGRLLWSAEGARLISVELPPGSRGLGFYRRGALLVGGPGSPAACLSWSRPTGPV